MKNFTIKGILKEYDGTEHSVEILATYSKGGFQYGNGYYLSFEGLIDGAPRIDRLYDVRYEVIEDFRSYALDTIKSIWSGKNGSWKFVEA